MIYIQEDQLQQLSYLMDQSLRGYHFLFDLDHIRKAFSEEEENIESSQDESALIETEKHMETLLAQPTLLHKKAYLEQLDDFTFQLVVRTYFSILEHHIQSKEEILQ